jgi:hypothetical protein
MSAMIKTKSRDKHEALYQGPARISNPMAEHAEM